MKDAKMTDGKAERNAKRLLVLMYDMSGGSTSVRVEQAALFAKAKEMNLFGMSEIEFDAYRATLRNRPSPNVARAGDA